MDNGIEDINGFKEYDNETKKLTIRNVDVLDKRILEYKDMINVLDASYCGLTSLEDWVQELTKTKVFFLSDNEFDEFPHVFQYMNWVITIALKNCKLKRFEENAHPDSLLWLILTNNPKMGNLPNSIGNTQLKKAALVNTGMNKLTEAILDTPVELLRVNANKDLRGAFDIAQELKTLAWYGDASNSDSHKIDIQKNVNFFSWKLLKIGKKIGESPSSDVFEAIITRTNIKVAVKLYRRGITSDGWPKDDMKATITVGGHDNITKILGIINGHPEGRSGLVLGLIGDEFVQLGNPPNLETITRDTFNEDSSFSIKYILNVIKTISSACGHIHGKKNIMHGDIYAHNTKSKICGSSLLLDLGAASPYKEEQGIARESIDIKAFGFLIDDLLKNCNNSEMDQILFAKIEGIKNNCIDNDIGNRPSFKEIYATVNSML